MIDCSSEHRPNRSFPRMAASLMSVALIACVQAVHGMELTWEERPLPRPDVRFEQVVSSGSLLLARAVVIDDPIGPGLLFTSDNGLDWTPIDPGLAGRSIDAIGYALDRFVVVLDGGQLLLGSGDAGSWFTRPAPDEEFLDVNHVIEHGGRVWVLARWRTGMPRAGLLSIADFETWTPAYLTTFDGVTFVPGLSGLAAAGGVFATTRTDPPPSVPFGAALTITSDGSDWLVSGGVGPLVHSGGVAWNGSAFLAVAAGPFDGSSAPLRLVRRTPNGETDIVKQPEWVGRFRSFRGGPDGLIVQRLDDEANELLTSSDGTKWSMEPTVPTGSFRDFIRWQDGWVGVGTTAIRGVPQQATPVPTLAPFGLMLLAFVLVITSSVATRRPPDRRPRSRPTSPSGSSGPGG